MNVFVENVQLNFIFQPARFSLSVSIIVHLGRQKHSRRKCCFIFSEMNSNLIPHSVQLNVNVIATDNVHPILSTIKQVNYEILLCVLELNHAVGIRILPVVKQ